MKKHVLVLVALLVLAGAAMFAGSARADYGPLAVYQVTISSNCNNRAICGSDLGGFWGWGVFNSDGTVDAELTGCSHGGDFNGAIHFHVDGTGWFIQDGMFVVGSETDTYVGRFAHVETGTNEETGIPAAPGHYSATDILGFTAPGVSFNIEVVKIPNR